MNHPLCVSPRSMTLLAYHFIYNESVEPLVLLDVHHHIHFFKKVSCGCRSENKKPKSQSHGQEWLCMKNHVILAKSCDSVPFFRCPSTSMLNEIHQQKTWNLFAQVGEVVVLNRSDGSTRFGVLQKLHEPEEVSPTRSEQRNHHLLQRIPTVAHAFTRGPDSQIIITMCIYKFQTSHDSIARKPWLLHFSVKHLHCAFLWIFESVATCSFFSVFLSLWLSIHLVSSHSLSMIHFACACILLRTCTFLGNLFFVDMYWEHALAIRQIGKKSADNTSIYIYIYIYIYINIIYQYIDVCVYIIYIYICICIYICRMTTQWS
jgi:hypothetical protein